MKDLKKKTVLVTGATGGLGIEMVKAFLREESELILTDIKQETLNELEKEYSGYGKGRILGSFAGDLSTVQGCENVITNTKRFCETPDILVNNAGIVLIGHFVNVPKDKWEKMLSVNLNAPLQLIYSFLPGMIKRGSGHIVNISSVAGLYASTGFAAYSASKFGLKAFGEALSREISSHGVAVTNVYPFITRTPLLQAEQHGVSEKKSVPDFVISEPSDVINDMIVGIKQNDLHVHPGFFSKSMDVLSRFAPWILDSFGNVVK